MCSLARFLRCHFAYFNVLYLLTVSPNNGYDLFIESPSYASVRMRWEVSGSGHDMGGCESVGEVGE
jgi:hypothetical protein